MRLRGRLGAVYRLMGPRKGETILDVGCSAGHFSCALWKNNTVIGIDVSKIALTQAKTNRNVNFILGSAISLPFRNSTFSKIAMLELLEHLNGMEIKALWEINRVLETNGLFFLSTPNKGKFSSCLPLDPSYLALRRHRHFSTQSVLRLLETAHFGAIKIYTGGLFAEQFAYLLSIFHEFFMFSVYGGVRNTLHLLAFRGLWISSSQKRLEASESGIFGRVSGFLWAMADREYERGLKSEDTGFYSIIGVAKKTG